MHTAAKVLLIIGAIASVIGIAGMALGAGQVDDLEDEWFKTVLPLGLKNFDEDTLDKLSEGEIRELTASVYIFLTKFGSTALAKQFVSASKEIQKKEQEQ